MIAELDESVFLKQCARWEPLEPDWEPESTAPIGPLEHVPMVPAPRGFILALELTIDEWRRLREVRTSPEWQRRIENEPKAEHFGGNKRKQPFYPPSTIRCIERLLVSRREWSIRKIAKKCCVPSRIVKEVRDGRRTAEGPVSEFLLFGEAWCDPPVLCHECGAQITITPCRACKARNASR